MKKMTIEELKKEIEKQKEINTTLYKSIPLPSREDPDNKKAQPVLAEWRVKSGELKEMIKKLQALEIDIPTLKQESFRPFVNSYGEATKREITSAVYRRTEKRLERDVLAFVGQ
jgi:hypothetical protein